MTRQNHHSSSDPVMALVRNRPGFEDFAAAGQSEALKLSECIYQSSGTSNAYLLLTEAGRVIINTGMGFEALTHKRLFDAVSEGPTPYIILTQGHVDHIGGVAQFRGPETQVVAQANHHHCLRDDERIKAVRVSQAGIWFQSIFDSVLSVAAAHPEVLAPAPPEPDILFEQHLNLCIGGTELELIATPGGETADSCVVWWPVERTLFSGNLFGPLFPHFPNINTLRGDKYRFLEPYLESLHQVRKLAPELLITGHFTPIKGWPLIEACLERLERAVRYVHDETLAGMNAGVDIWTLMRDIALPSELQVGQGYGKVAWAVRTIWESYMGWFKAQRSSELYATQACDIHAELVELAGPATIMDRARTALKRGDAERALLLSEAVLSCTPDEASALRLNLDVHRNLLLQVPDHNFWESGWLKHIIRQRESRLAELGT